MKKFLRWVALHGKHCENRLEYSASVVTAQKSVIQPQLE